MASLRVADLLDLFARIPQPRRELFLSKVRFLKMEYCCPELIQGVTFHSIFYHHQKVIR
jgi:hypothetical protein